jgi:hypothetical protein
MKPSGVSKVTVLKVAVASKPTNMLASESPLSYGVDVLERTSVNGPGFKAVYASHSANLADAFALNLFLVPSVQRGVNGFHLGTMEMSKNGTALQPIDDRLMTLSPMMKPYQCFTGVTPYAMPPEDRKSRWPDFLFSRPGV